MNIKTSACLAAIVASISTLASAAPTITSRQLINSVRVSRTVYDYTYRVTINGDSGDYQSVTAKLTQVGNGTSIIDGNITVGALGPNASVAPADTFTIRQDRTLPFNANALVWEVKALEQGLIPGDTNESAAALMPDITGRLLVKVSDYSVDSSGAVTLRTGAIIGLHPDARIGEVNAFLKSHGAKIVEAIPGVSAFAISIPDVGSVEQLSLFLSDLESDISVDFALPIQEPENNATQADNGLPDQITQSGDIAYIAHQLAVGGAGVWNTRRAAHNTAKNDLVNLIYDKFGKGLPFNDLYQFKEEAPLPFMGIASPKDVLPGNDSPSGHGYAVTSIIGARFDMQKTAGLFVPELPFTPRVSFIDNYKANHAIDCLAGTPPLSCVPYFETPENNYVGHFAVARALRYYSQNNRVVLNISQAALWTQDIAIKEKNILLWDRLLYDGYGVLSSNVGSPAIAGNIIQVTSAGNEVFPIISSDWKAEDNSIWNAHALNRPVKNALVVEARDVVRTNKGRFSPGNKTSTTLSGGNIAAIGGGSVAATNDKGLWALIDNIGTVNNMLNNNIVDNFLGINDILGTSFSAPQVAALASLVWQIQPTWTSSKVVSHIIVNASNDNKYSDGAPVISAYETLLTLDKMPSSSSSASNDAPVRNALFDVNKDGSFEIEDVKLAAKALADGNGKDLYGDGFDQEGSRFDFNADGYLGGEKTKPFNHDMSTDNTGKATLDEELQLPTVPQMPELSSFDGFSILAYQGSQSDLSPYLKLDENKATDADILCYAIASKLLSGDQSKAYDEASKLGLGCYDFAGDFSVVYDKVQAGYTTGNRFDPIPIFKPKLGVATLNGHVIPAVSPSQNTECAPPKDFVSANGVVLALKLESPPPVQLEYTTQIFSNPDKFGCDGFLGLEPQQSSPFPAYKLKLYGKSFEIDYVQTGRSVLGRAEFTTHISIEGQTFDLPNQNFFGEVSFDAVIRKSIVP